MAYSFFPCGSFMLFILVLLLAAVTLKSVQENDNYAAMREKPKDFASESIARA
ncbi:hypothetical protein RchiOBHm_Chr2g0153051 [Rosa chinensis]|uniref:Uncharacterized protein n=1 Tax=Rosa chinensis TaxID=74649 RepID=A0A2P6S0P6_ROSCH|nr:hypothetical protein RchiOBHm_Chr2g0153051 [Rosa chinensis]